MIRLATRITSACRSVVVTPNTTAAHVGKRWSSVLVDKQDGGKAVISLKSPPVNSLSLELISELTDAFHQVEADKDVRGVILTSASPKIFSAGLDITEMYQPDLERLPKFWTSLQDLWKTIFTSKVATVAAINGHSPAGGCLLAVSCDHRVMANDGNYTIGLNEVQLGIVAPFWFVDTFVGTVRSERDALRLLQLGSLLPADEAKEVGMVDDAVPSDNVMDVAHTALDQYLAVHDHARHLSKMMVRRNTLVNFEKGREQDVKDFVAAVDNEKVQAVLGHYMAKLAGRKKK